MAGGPMFLRLVTLPFSSSRRRRRSGLFGTLLAVPVLLLVYWQLFARYDTRPGGGGRTISLLGGVRSDGDSASDLFEPPDWVLGSNLTVDLVVATLAADDVAWTERLPIPNLRVLRYVSDYEDAAAVRAKMATGPEKLAEIMKGTKAEQKIADERRRRRKQKIIELQKAKWAKKKQEEQRQRELDKAKATKKPNKRAAAATIPLGLQKRRTFPAEHYRPPVPRKGREATIYHTYLRDFYDELPDITIFVHAHENPWHLEGALLQSMEFALLRLDLSVLGKPIAQGGRGGYANLRVSWKDACPAWINTTMPLAFSTKQEEPFVGPVFREVFGAAAAPEIFAGPCCSQFAVTRDAIRRRPRDFYARAADWLVRTKLSDYVAGRVWEHLWPWVFLGPVDGEASGGGGGGPKTKEAVDADVGSTSWETAAVDCPVEWKAYCRMYGVCFAPGVGGPGGVAGAVRAFNSRWQAKEKLRRDFLEEWWNRLLHPFKAADAARRIDAEERALEAEMREALGRGEDENVRGREVGDLFEL